MLGSVPRSCSRAYLMLAGTATRAAGTTGARARGATTGAGAGAGAGAGGGADRAARGGGGGGGGRSDDRSSRTGSGSRSGLGSRSRLGGGDGGAGGDLLEIVGRPEAATAVSHDRDPDDVEAGIDHVGVVVGAVGEAGEDGVDA